MDYSMWFFSIFIYYGLCSAADLPCNQRVAQFGYVCVCNSSYCDTVERPPTLTYGQFYRYTTSSTSPGFTRTLGHFSNFSSDADYTFTVNTSTIRQEIVGMGGSFTNTVGLHYQTLSNSTRKKFIESYYGINGIEYSMGRVPIASSDFTLRSYSFDDVSFDNKLQYFNLTSEEYNFKIPIIQDAMTVSARVLKLIGCSWNPPIWMKVNNANSYGYVRQNYSSIWAKYHVKFLEMYKREGLQFWGLSGGNQMFVPMLIPKIRVIHLAASTALQQREWFTNHLKPHLMAGNFSDVKLIAMEDQRLFALYWMDRFANDPEAYKTLDGIGLHWYLDPFISPTVLDRIHQKYPEKLILYTETSINFGYGPESVQLGGWHRAEAYANNIIQNFNHWVQSYMDWNLMLDTEGGPSISVKIDSPVIINTTSGEFYKQPMFYVLGHFSKFIPPGSRVVQVNAGQPELSERYPPFSAASFLEERLKELSVSRLIPLSLPSTVQCIATANTDGSYSIFLLNSQNTTARVRVEDPQVGSISYLMEPHSLNTIVYWK